MQNIRDVQLEDIARHNSDIVIAFKRLSEHGGEFLVQLDGDDACPRLGEPLRQRPDAGTDL